MPVPEATDAELQAVKGAIDTLVRTERMVRTYPVGNQLSQNLLADLLSKLPEVLPLELRVARDQLIWNDVPLLEADRDRSDIAGRLYKDGVRILRLGAQIDADELERFIVSLATPLHPDDLSEDYVTRIWEANLPNVRVVAIDPYLDLDVPDEVLEGKYVPTAEVEDIGTVSEREGEELDIPPPPEEAFRIPHEDAGRIAQEIERATTPPWSTFMIALFDLMGNESTSGRLEELVSLLEATFQRTLRDGQADVATELLLRIRADVPAVADQAVREALFRMGHADRLQPLHDALEAGSCDPEAAERVFVLLGEWIPETPCSLLTAAKMDRSRRFYADVLAKIGQPAFEPVLQHIHTAADGAKPHFVRVLGKLSDERAIEPLTALTRSANPALRREALRGLASMLRNGAEPQLTRAALSDADAPVRLVALKCLASLRSELDPGPLIARVSSSEARALADEELDLLYVTIGATNRPEALEFLGERIRPGWLRGRSDARTWVRAARALASMRQPEARLALETGARSGKKELAEICASALEQAGNT